MTLNVILEPGEDGKVIARVPDLPGCYSQGETRDDALANIKEAIDGWLDLPYSSDRPALLISPPAPPG